MEKKTQSNKKIQSNEHTNKKIDHNFINPQNDIIFKDKKNELTSLLIAKNDILLGQKNDRAGSSQDHINSPAQPIDPLLDVKLIIQERYEKNHENGISYDDFIQTFGQDIVDQLQRAINTLSLDDISKAARKITENKPSMNKSHHIGNIAQYMQLTVMDHLKNLSQNHHVSLNPKKDTL